MMANILREYMRIRKGAPKDYLFCDVYGGQLTEDALRHAIRRYHNHRGVKTASIHKYRHTFAKQWILNGGNVVSLSKILGHSSLQITQNYVNLLVSDVAKEVESINLLDKFATTERIRMR